MSSYIGRHAELYEIFYAEKEYRAEADFVHRCFLEFGISEDARLLELACGTGSHAFELEKLNHAIVATDYSHDMLERARMRAMREGSKVEFRLQDMQALDVPERPFDGAYCLFDSLGYAVTNEGVLAALRGTHRHLRPKGLFVFEFWHAPAMIRHYEPVRVRTWNTGDSDIVRISETTLDFQHQVAQVHYTILELKNDGTYSSLKESQVNRFFQVEEMSNLLTMCGFAPLKWFAGFNLDERISDETWHVVAVARRL